MAVLSEGFIISKNERTVIRKCPFCDSHTEDFRGQEINFIVHLGSPILAHQGKKCME